MNKQNGPWTIEKSERKYRDNFIELKVDRVIRPDGEPGTYATVKIIDGVAVLPVDDEASVFLTSQFRYSLGRESIEAVSGGIDEGEDPLDAAQREAREEAGICAETWEDLGIFHGDTSILKGSVRLYVARDLTFGNPEREGTEVMKIIKVPFERAVQMVMDSEISHGPTCVLILKAHLASRNESE